MSEIEKDIVGNLIGKTHKEIGFTTPNNYFNDMKSSILSKINDDKLLVENQTGGFKVADTFFEKQKMQILSKTIKPQAKKISLAYNQLMLRIASVAAMLTIVGFLFLHTKSTKTADLSASVSAEEIVNHLEKNDVSEDLICELLDQNKSVKKETDLEKYLNDHADEDLLIDEL